MPSLSVIRQSNSHLKQAQPGLVAVFTGATSGIGESTCKQFVQHTPSPTVYIVGRNTSKGSAIIRELRSLNPEVTAHFIEADLTLLSAVDKVVQLVGEKESKVNLLFMSQGFLSLQGRQETTEGLDKMVSLQYFSRMRLITQLMPLLHQGARHEMGRVVSVLGAGNEAQISPDNIEVKGSYDLKAASGQAITMTSLSMNQLAMENPDISFLHVYPGVVRGTGITTGMGHMINLVSRFVMATIARPFTISVNESGERHLYAATSPALAPVQQREGKGSSFFRLASNGEPCGPNPILDEYEKNGTQEKIWTKTQEIVERITGGALAARKG